VLQFVLWFTVDGVGLGGVGGHHCSKPEGFRVCVCVYLCGIEGEPCRHDGHDSEACCVALLPGSGG
jgi:hypothetical protein